MAFQKKRMKRPKKLSNEDLVAKEDNFRIISRR